MISIIGKIFDFFGRKEKLKIEDTHHFHKDFVFHKKFSDMDLCWPKNPKNGDRHHWDGFFVEIEQNGKRYKKQMTLYFEFDGKNWIPDVTFININPGKEGWKEIVETKEKE